VFRRYTPTAESLRQSRWVGWLGPRAREPQAWRFDRRRVARGVAIGAFTAILLPVGQLLPAGVAALMLRASPLAAVCTTFISNPLTIGPIYYAAYKLGALLLGLAGMRASAPQAAERAGEWLGNGWSMFVVHGLPMLLGTILLALAAGAIGYFVTHGIWRRRAHARRARTRALRQVRGPLVRRPDFEPVAAEAGAPVTPTA
jgi:uncharacterized protein (DUF2062 family)